ncbi:hypothetical protein ARSQ2_01568 [Arsenophonus endosymbiont of Bemisia tabaci Q2]|nr:hypothetical protein ARSQ2_01568 [Arsenophonus endosymbiont of Bemisia tabaci Q2]
MRHRYFVRTQYGVIKIKSLSYKIEIMRYRQEVYPRWYHQQFGI